MANQKQPHVLPAALPLTSRLHLRTAVLQNLSKHATDIPMSSVLTLLDWLLALCASQPPHRNDLVPYDGDEDSELATQLSRKDRIILEHVITTFACTQSHAPPAEFCMILEKTWALVQVGPRDEEGTPMDSSRLWFFCDDNRADAGKLVDSIDDQLHKDIDWDSDPFVCNLLVGHYIGVCLTGMKNSTMTGALMSAADHIENNFPDAHPFLIRTLNNCIISEGTRLAPESSIDELRTVVKKLRSFINDSPSHMLYFFKVAAEKLAHESDPTPEVAYELLTELRPFPLAKVLHENALSTHQMICGIIRIATCACKEKKFHLFVNLGKCLVYLLKLQKDGYKLANEGNVTGYRTAVEIERFIEVVWEIPAAHGSQISPTLMIEVMQLAQKLNGFVSLLSSYSGNEGSEQSQGSASSSSSSSVDGRCAFSRVRLAGDV